MAIHIPYGTRPSLLSRFPSIVIRAAVLLFAAFGLLVVGLITLGQLGDRITARLNARLTTVQTLDEVLLQQGPLVRCERITPESLRYGIRVMLRDPKKNRVFVLRYRLSQAGIVFEVDSTGRIVTRIPDFAL